MGRWQGKHAAYLTACPDQGRIPPGGEIDDSVFQIKLGCRIDTVRHFWVTKLGLSCRAHIVDFCGFHCCYRVFNAKWRTNMALH